MKCIFTFLGLFFSVCAIAQLTVKPTASNTDSFIYVQDQILFVEQDVNLVPNTDAATEASIYLRREGQLIQGITSSANTGMGKISVYQEGSTNKFDYNNWTSPVSLPPTDGSNGNGTFGYTLLHTPIDGSKTQPRNVTTKGSFNSIGGTGTTLQIPEYWFFYYPGGNEYEHFIQFEDETDRVPVGYGFTMKGVSEQDTSVPDAGEGIVNNTGDFTSGSPDGGQRYDFIGRPNSGSVPIGPSAGSHVTNPAELAINGDEIIFIGNPYPSALNLSYFLLENSTQITNEDGSTTASTLDCSGAGAITRKNNITGVAYFWDSRPGVNSHQLTQYEGGYETFTPVNCDTTGMSVGAPYNTYDTNGDIETTGMVGQGASRERRNIGIAQGFLVQTVENPDFVSDPTNMSIIFENRHRVYSKESDGNVEFHRATTKKGAESDDLEPELFVIPKMMLNIEADDLYTRQLALGFWHTATKGVDGGMDAPAADGLPTDAGFVIDDERYVIDVRPFDKTDQISLVVTVNNNQSNVKFTATSFENFKTDNVYIYDNSTGNYYDVNYNSWSITLEKGTYNDRFFLTFQKQEVLDTEEFAVDNFDVFQNNRAFQLEIRNPNGLALKSVSIFNVTGKQVITQSNLESESLYTFSTRTLQEAVYIVKIRTADDIEVAKKITVTNSN